MALTQASEEGLKISNAGTNGQYLQKQSGNAGGLTWADVPAGVGGGTGVDFNDSVKARFGTGDDLQLYHDGSDSWIRDAGTGRLLIDGSEVHIRKYGAAETMAKFIEDGAVELYHDNSKKLATSASGVEIENGDLRIHADAKILGDNRKLYFGAGNDISIFHNGTDSFLDSITGSLKIRSNTGNMAVFTPDGAVELYHNEVKKFSTTSGGANLEGSLVLDKGNTVKYHRIVSNDTGSDLAFQQSAANSDASYTSYLRIKDGGDVWLPVDSKKLLLGAGNDLEIYHDGSDSFMENSTGDLYLRNKSGNDDKDVVIQAKSGEHSIVCRDDGAVDLYYDSTKRFETTNIGAHVLGYSANTGVGYAASQIFEINNSHDADNAHSALSFTFAAQDRGAAIYAAYRNTAGEADLILAPEYNEVAAIFKPHAGCHLYYDNSPRLDTTSDGIRVEGPEGSQAAISLEADQGDDNADKWQIVAQDGGDNAFSIKTLYTGSWATGLKILINSQDNPCIQAPKGGLRFDENNTHTSANFDSINGDGHLARIDGQAWLTADDYFRIRDLDNAEDKRFEFNTDSGNAGAMNDWQDDQFDFAEMFEWSDGNPDDEDRIGHTVAIDGVTGKIKIAQTGDTVIGVVSGTAAFTANCAGLYWHNAYLRDEWGRYKYRYITDDDGNTVYNDPDNGNVRPKKKLIRNPNWDQERSYHRRTDRKEWDKIGIIGQCYVRKTAVIPSTWIKLKEIDSTKDFYLIK